MRCQITGCENVGIIEDEEGDLVLCEAHAKAGIVADPEYTPTAPERLCECATCINRRRASASAYTAMMLGVSQ